MLASPVFGVAGVSPLVPLVTTSMPSTALLTLPPIPPILTQLNQTGSNLFPFSGAIGYNHSASSAQVTRRPSQHSSSSPPLTFIVSGPSSKGSSTSSHHNHHHQKQQQQQQQIYPSHQSLNHHQGQQYRPKQNLTNLTLSPSPTLSSSTTTTTKNQFNVNSLFATNTNNNNNILANRAPGLTNHTGGAICIHRLCVRQNGQASSGVEICYNDKGNIVKHGEQYIPIGIDTCTQCTCMHGKAEMCISVLCSPPENCRNYHTINKKCCEFLCLDSDMSGQRFFNKTTLSSGGGSTGGKGDPKTFSSISTSNLGLRLIASTITSFLILALLLFMIHRLRQRRLLMMIRRLQTRRLEQVNGPNGPPATNTGGGGHHGFRFGYFGSRSNHQGLNSGPGSGGAGGGGGPFGFGFIEPPPPYTFWKPPEQFIAPGEAPPPYEEIIGGGGADLTPQTVQQQQQLPCYDQQPPPPPQSIVSMVPTQSLLPGTNPQVQAHLNNSNSGNVPGTVSLYLPPSVATAQNDFCSFYQSPNQLAQAPAAASATSYHPGHSLALDSGRSLSSLASPASLSLPPGSGQYEQTYSKTYQPAHQTQSHLSHHSQHSQSQSQQQRQHYASGQLVRHHSFANATSTKQLAGLQSQLALSSLIASSATYHPGTHRHHSQQSINHYQQPHRLITHLASSLNASSQAYITSPVVAGGVSTSLQTIQPHPQQSSQPALSSIDPSDYEHITVLRIGSNNGGGTTSNLGPVPASSHSRLSGTSMHGVGPPPHIYQSSYPSQAQQYPGQYQNYHYPNSYQPRVTALGINPLATDNSSTSSTRPVSSAAIFNPMNVDSLDHSRLRTESKSSTSNPSHLSTVEFDQSRTTTHKSHKKLPKVSDSSLTDPMGPTQHRSHHHHHNHHRHRRRSTLPPVPAPAPSQHQTVAGPMAPNADRSLDTDPNRWFSTLSSSSSSSSTTSSSSLSTSATCSSSSSSSLSSMANSKSQSPMGQSYGGSSLGPNSSGALNASPSPSTTTTTSTTTTSSSSVIFNSSPTSSSSSLSSSSQSTVIAARRLVAILQDSASTTPNTASATVNDPSSAKNTNSTRQSKLISGPDSTQSNSIQNSEFQSPPPVLVAVSAKIDIDTISRL